MKTLLLVIALLQFGIVNAQNLNSLEFDGTNWVDGTATASLDATATNRVTIAAWVNTDNLISQQRVFTVGTGSGVSQQYALMLTPTGELYFISDAALFQANGVNIGNASINANEWVYIVATYDGAAVRLYINGVLDYENFIVDNFPTGMANMFIMGSRFDGAEKFDGNIDEVHVWNIALGSSQIAQYMDCRPLGNEAGLVAYWNFDEGTGTNLGDITVNGNDGTLMTSPVWSTDVHLFNCGVGIEELNNTPKQLIKIVDLMGRETLYKPNTVLIYVFDDGSTEKVFKMEE